VVVVGFPGPIGPAIVVLLILSRITRLPGTLHTTGLKSIVFIQHTVGVCISPPALDSPEFEVVSLDVILSMKKYTERQHSGDCADSTMYSILWI
jgi:hypothetical protein